MTQERHDPVQRDARLLELIELLREEAISDQQFAELQDLVVNDPEARKMYVDAIALQSNLEWTQDIIDTTQPALEMSTLDADDEPEDLLLGLSCLSTMSEDPWGCMADEKDGSSDEEKRGLWGSLSLMVDQAMNSPTGFTVWVSLVVLIPVALLFVVMSRPPVEYVPMVAKITQQTPGNKWQGIPDGTLLAGSDLNEGQKYTLQTGLAEIMFANGARMVVHGPTTFVVDNCDLVRLDSGQCVAHVPQSATGFTIDANGSRVVDLGTEFGIKTDTEEETEVYVFDGKVDFSLRDDPKATKIELTENQGIRSSARSGKVTPAKVDTRQFIRNFNTKGVLDLLLLKNNSFEEPDFSDQNWTEPDGIYRSIAIPHWETSVPTSQRNRTKVHRNPYIGCYLWDSKHGPRHKSGVTEDAQACVFTLGNGSKPGILPNTSAWIYRSLGRIQAKDIGGTLRLSIDCLAKTPKEENDARLTVGFATGLSATDPGSFVGHPGSCNGKVARSNTQTIGAFLKIPAKMIGEELFIAIRVEDPSPGSAEDLYLFDNLNFESRSRN